MPTPFRCQQFQQLHHFGNSAWMISRILSLLSYAGYFRKSCTELTCPSSRHVFDSKCDTRRIILDVWRPTRSPSWGQTSKQSIYSWRKNHASLPKQSALHPEPPQRNDLFGLDTLCGFGAILSDMWNKNTSPVTMPNHVNAGYALWKLFLYQGYSGSHCLLRTACAWWKVQEVWPITAVCKDNHAAINDHLLRVWPQLLGVWGVVPGTSKAIAIRQLSIPSMSKLYQGEPK